MVFRFDVFDFSGGDGDEESCFGGGGGGGGGDDEFGDFTDLMNDCELDLPQFYDASSSPLVHINDKRREFWSPSENDYSADLSCQIIHEKVKSAISMFSRPSLICQFWAPVTIGGRQLLTTLDQPYSVGDLSRESSFYRQYSEQYKYIIEDENKLEDEWDHMIISGGQATAFLNCLPYICDLHWVPSNYSISVPNLSFMLPICFPPRSSCVGVLELTCPSNCNLSCSVLDAIKALKEAGLDVFPVQERIPYKTISDLKPAKDEIEKALKFACVSHNLALAQVRIAYEDKNHVSSSSLEDGGRMLALKLTGYLLNESLDDDESNFFRMYYSLCDVIPQGFGENLARKTLQDYRSRYVSRISSDALLDWHTKLFKTSALSICLRSSNTGDIDYAFEFIWINRSDHDILLEALFLTLERRLPSFKFASGAKLGDQLDVINVETSRDDDEDETVKLMIFQGKTSSSMSEVLARNKRSKTAPIELSIEEVEKQFGKTIDTAAENLKVSNSSLRRWWKKYFQNAGKKYNPWPGPRLMKRKANDSSTIHSNTNDDANEASSSLSVPR